MMNDRASDKKDEGFLAQDIVDLINEEQGEAMKTVLAQSELSSPTPYQRRGRASGFSMNEGGGQDARAPCVDETMKPTSESLSPSETWNRRVAECYCGAAMRRGELHKAKDQPQTKVNSIRPGHLASRRRGGMHPRGWVPCEARDHCDHTTSSDIARYMLTGGNVRVIGVRMVRRPHGLNQDPCGAQEPAAGGRALIVAMKRLITVERRGVGR